MARRAFVAVRQAAHERTVTVMFTDIVGSTQLALRLGDRRWLSLLAGHEALVRRRAEAQGGSLLKCQGDGFMLAFPSAGAALRCASAVQRDLAASARGPHADRLEVRIGVHSGEALEWEGDLFGRCVIFAARLAQCARGGEILASSRVRDLAAGVDGIEFTRGRELRLEGFEVEWAFGVRWGAG